MNPIAKNHLWKAPSSLIFTITTLVLLFSNSIAGAWYVVIKPTFPPSIPDSSAGDVSYQYIFGGRAHGTIQCEPFDVENQLAAGTLEWTTVGSSQWGRGYYESHQFGVGRCWDCNFKTSGLDQFAYASLQDGVSQCSPSQCWSWYVDCDGTATFIDLSSDPDTGEPRCWYEVPPVPDCDMTTNHFEGKDASGNPLWTVDYIHTGPCWYFHKEDCQCNANTTTHPMIYGSGAYYELDVWIKQGVTPPSLQDLGIPSQPTSASAGSTAGSGGPPAGLVSWWPAEGNGDDIIGGNNGALNGVAFDNGMVGQGFSLDGTSSYVLIPNAPSLNPAGGFTIEGWIYPTRDARQAIVSKWGDQGAYSGNRSYSFETTAGGGLSFAISDLANQNNGAFQAFAVSGVLTLNAWNHIAATYDSASGTRCLYVNGVMVGSHENDPVAPYASITPVTIGSWMRSPTSTQDYFQGKIDELGLYQRPLSSSEIQSIYNAGSAGKCH